MSKLRPTPGKKVIRALEKLGFLVVRTNGSHVILKHRSGKSATVPVHGGSDIPRPTLINIVTKQAQVSEDSFLKYLK